MRSFIRVVLAFLFGFMLMLISISLYLFEFGGLEKIVNAQVADLLEQQYDLELTVGEIRGDIVSGMVLEDVVIHYRSPTTRYRLAFLPRISVAYSLSNLWNRKYLLEYLHFDSAVVTVMIDSTGRWLLPRLSSESEGRERPGLEISLSDLEINGATLLLLLPTDTISFSDIGLSAAVSGSEGTWSLDLKRLRFTGSDERRSLDGMTGKLTYSSRRLVVSDVAAIRGRGRVKLDGHLELTEPPAGRMELELDQVDLSEISSWLGAKLTGLVDVNGYVSLAQGGIEGSVDIAGDFMFIGFENLSTRFRYADRLLVLDTLYGTILENCVIDGSGRIDLAAKPERYQLDAEIINFNLEQLVAGTFRSDLTGRIALTGSSFRSRDMLLEIATSLHNSSFDEYPLHQAAGDLTITTDSICFADSFRVEYFENVFHVSGRIDYSNDIDLTVDADLGNLDRYRGKLFLDQPGGRGHADGTISGRTVDPNLRGMFVSDSVWLYGFYSSDLAASVKLERFLTGRRGTVEVVSADGTAWDLPYDTAHTILVTDSHLVHIDTFCMANEYSRLHGGGLFDYGVEPMRMRLDTLTLILFDQSFFNQSIIEFEIDSAGFDFRQASIGAGSAGLSLTGWIGYDETMDVELLVDHVPVAPWINLFDTTFEVNGALSCRAQIDGNFRQPQFELQGSVDSLTYRDLYLGTMVTGMKYRHQLLTLDSLLVRSPTADYRAVGSFHANLAFTSDPLDRFPELPINIDITARDHRFDLVSLVMPSVEQLDGEFFADFTLSGTPHAPHLEGEAFIRRARLKYFDLEQPLWADSAGATLTDNRIVIDRITVRAADRDSDGEKGKAYIRGEVMVRSLDSLYYNLNISMPREFPFQYELDDINGVVEGEVHVEGDTPPLVTGNLTIVDMKYLVNFADEKEGSPVMRALSGENTWDLNLNIEIPSNYWVKNDDIDAEFSGHVNLIREGGIYRFMGEMEILRGRGFLFDKTFQLEPGGLVIFEGNPTVNPRLDITGYTRIAGYRQFSDDELQTMEPLELGIRITGTLEIPEINPVEGSNFNREDILPLIIANYYSSDSVSTSGQIEQRLSGLVSSQVSRIGARRLGQLGVETFEIDPVYGGDYDPLKARVTVGFYTAPNLYVYGRSTISGQTRQEVGFEYRFNKAFLLEGRRDEEELYHMALKLHWEF
ncbi:MAG: translocation/assembly module TamB domain-containing protein [bacterium]